MTAYHADRCANPLWTLLTRRQCQVKDFIQSAKTLVAASPTILWLICMV
jgi:hypothetical protein